MAVEFIHLVAEGRQFFLQRDACVARQLPVVFGPRRLDQSATVDAVGQMADCNRVGIGVVVLLQDIEIFRDDKARAIGAAWENRIPCPGVGNGFPSARRRPSASHSVKVARLRI